jgi:hypothetical protein
MMYELKDIQTPEGLKEAKEYHNSHIEGHNIFCLCNFHCDEPCKFDKDIAQDWCKKLKLNKKEFENSIYWANKIFGNKNL